jgi:hypothetical protein
MDETLPPPVTPNGVDLERAQIGTPSRLTVVSVAGRPSCVAGACAANLVLFGAHLPAYPLGLLSHSAVGGHRHDRDAAHSRLRRLAQIWRIRLRALDDARLDRHEGDAWTIREIAFRVAESSYDADAVGDPS